jgi:hypothetical protein
MNKVRIETLDVTNINRQKPSKKRKKQRKTRQVANFFVTVLCRGVTKSLRDVPKE